MVNQAFLATHAPDQITVEIVKVEENHELSSDNPAVELAEMWSDGGHKGHKRWRWHALDREPRQVLA